MLAVNTKKTPAQAVLYVPPKMTKTEVKEYLTKIYNVSVLEVMTAYLLGALLCGEERALIPSSRLPVPHQMKRSSPRFAHNE